MGTLSCVEWLARGVLAHTQLSYPRRRVSSTPLPIQVITDISGILDRPLSRTMTAESAAESTQRHT